MDRGLDLDFHVDEMTDPDAKSFDNIAEALIRADFGKRSFGVAASLDTAFT